VLLSVLVGGPGILIRQMQCEREEASFFEVDAVRRREAARSRSERASAVLEMGCSAAPERWIVPWASSRMEIGLRLVRRSKVVFPESSMIVRRIRGCGGGLMSLWFEELEVSDPITSWERVLMVKVLPEPVWP